MHSMSKIRHAWLHVASIDRDRALSSLLFALKAKINYETPALSRYVNGRGTCTERTCVCISYVESRTPLWANGPFRASAYPLACKITFFFLFAIRFNSFSHYQPRTLFDITPRWAYRLVSSVQIVLYIISIENNPLLAAYI